MGRIRSPCARMRPGGGTPDVSPAGRQRGGDPTPRRRLPSGRHGLSREQVAESQRQRIFDAMAALCAERGYVATSVADIVERARVSRATFYQLFRDKEDCCVAAIDSHLRRLVVAVGPAYTSKAPWPERVRASIQALLEFLVEEPNYARLAMIEAMAAGDRAYETYTVALRLIVSMMEEGRRQIDCNWALPSTAARAAVGAAETLIVSELLTNRPERVLMLLPDILYCILLPYLGAERALQHAAEASAATGRAGP